MWLSDDEVRQCFHKSYSPTWKLHQFIHSVWHVEYIFDENGPTETEFEPVFQVVGPYLGETREGFAHRMNGCGGFFTGQVCTALQVQTLLDAGVRIELTEIRPGDHLIYCGAGRYWLVESLALRDELTAWMLSQDAEVEIRSID